MTRLEELGKGWIIDLSCMPSGAWRLEITLPRDGASTFVYVGSLESVAPRDHAAARRRLHVRVRRFARERDRSRVGRRTARRADRLVTLFLDGFAPTALWSHVPVEDPRVASLYDRHYSRQTPGARGVLAPGRRFVLWHENRGGAAWGVVYNVFRDVWRFRNALFRNESATLSSALIVAATAETYSIFGRRYGLPIEPLESEIDIDLTRARRGKSRPPGYCYECAGWTWVRSTFGSGHDKSRKAIYRAPAPERLP